MIDFTNINHLFNIPPHICLRLLSSEDEVLIVTLENMMGGACECCSNYASNIDTTEIKEIKVIDLTEGYVEVQTFNGDASEEDIVAWFNKTYPKPE